MEKLPKWYVKELKDNAVKTPRKHAKHTKPITNLKDVNYTVPGILALVAIVLVTAMYFTPGISMRASGNADVRNYAGYAYAGIDITAPDVCEVQSHCEGTKLIRQTSDCRQLSAWCSHGCVQQDDGAICVSR